MKIPAIHLIQNGRDLYVTKLSASFLADDSKVKVDEFNPSTQPPQGYQRAPSLARARDFSRYIREANGFSPSAILLNVREDVKAKLGYEDGEGHGWLTIPDDVTLYLVDGQHRNYGLKDAIEKDDRIGAFELPAVIMTQPNELDEAMQFVIINKTQKGVRADLAESIVARKIRADKGIRPEHQAYPRVVSRDIDLKLKADNIAKVLNSYDGPWKGQIIQPNEKSYGRPARLKSFTDSLLTILKDDGIARPYNDTQIAQMLTLYWQAISKLCPIASTDFKNYVLFRTSGIFSLHQVFPRVFRILQRAGVKKLDVKTFEDVLKVVQDLTLSPPKRILQDSYWSAQTGEAALMGTGQKSFGLLAEKITEGLEESQPKTAVETSAPFEL